MFQPDAWRIAAYFLIALLLGIMSDSITVCLLIASIAYITWLHVELGAVVHWLRDHKANEPPDAPGVFEELALEVDYLRERHKKRKKKLATYLKQFQQATRALPDATVMLDVNGEVRWANAAARRDLGVRWPEDVGQRITNLVRSPELRAFFERQSDGSTIEIESPLDAKRHLSVLLAPYGREQRLCVARDVSQLHRTNQIRRDFVANVSHELRTPITVFRGYLENLIAQSEQCPPAWRPALTQMMTHAERMRMLVEELLLLSTLERENRVPEPVTVNVSELIGDIHARGRELSGKREHLFSLEITAGLSVRGARNELYSAFSNLVFNAVEYTAARGIIRIRWYRDATGAHFEVEDNGIGIAAEHLPRLTERFYRVDAARARTEGGTGLGLAIVKHVLQRHNAQLVIQSQPGKGSRFRCDFPDSEIIELPTTELRALRDAS